MSKFERDFGGLEQEIRDDEAAAKATADKELKTRQKQWVEMMEKAQRLSAREVEPIFDGVNEGFLKGRGKLDLEEVYRKPEEAGEILGFGGSQFVYPLLDLSLEWDRVVYSPDSYEYNRLTARIGCSKDKAEVTINGGRKLDPDDEDFSAQVVAEIKEVLKDKGRHHFVQTPFSYDV
jgi:hypothetical protein